MEEDEDTAQPVLFMTELQKLADVNRGIMEVVMGNPTPTGQTIGRQCTDHLAAANLFLQQLGMYYMSLDGTTESAAEQAAVDGKIIQFPGGASSDV